MVKEVRPAIKAKEIPGTTSKCVRSQVFAYSINRLMHTVSQRYIKDVRQENAPHIKYKEAQKAATLVP